MKRRHFERRGPSTMKAVSVYAGLITRSIMGARFGKRLSRVSAAPMMLITGALALTMACSPAQRTESGAKAGPVVSVEELANGLDVVLVQNRSTPMICSSVIVKAGVMCETPELNGASHMLEHLLFNGTENRTQEELYNEVDFYGGYNNATTRADHTLFQMLIPAQHVEHGLDVQADMLFNSILPSEKLEKERDIVIEEIGKYEDDPGYAAGLFFDKVFYGGSPMGMPALGSRETAAAMSREGIADYYHKYYVPDNMAALVMGDFEKDEMMALLDKYFGAPLSRDQVDNSSGPGPEAREAHGRAPEEPPWKPYELHKTRLEADRNYIQISWPVPGWRDDGAAAHSMLEWLLNSGPASGLDRALKRSDRPLAYLAGAGYAPYSDGGIFSVWAQTPVDVEPEIVIFEMMSVIQNLAVRGSDLEEHLGASVSIVTQDLYYMERIHHYSMLKAPMLAVVSPQEFADHITSPAAVSPADVAVAARSLASATPFVACAAGPDLSEGVGPLAYSPPSFDSVPADAAAASSPDLSPRGVPVASSRVEIRREIDNGLVVVIKQNPDSRVFSTHVLVRDRAANEPPGKAGIADMLHRLLSAGTLKKNRQALERELNAIGAQVKTTDNPYIPFDNYYFVPEFSYLRFDTIDLFYKEGLRLLVEMLASPAFDEAEIERVRREMLAAIGKASGSTRSTAKRLFYEALFEGTPPVNPPGGTSRSIAVITREDLVDFHEQYLLPSNLIISVVGNVEADSVFAALEEAFESVPFESRPGTGPASRRHIVELPSTRERMLSEKMGKGQSYIYLGFTFDPPKEHEPALAVMAQILSDRMAFEIREKQGLAYSISASLSLRPQGAWLTASMGTRPQNVEAARKAMLASIEEMAQATVSEEELERTKNSMLGRHLMRTLFSMGQAYYAGLAEFYGPGHQGAGLLERVKDVTPSEVEQAASRYLSRDELLVMVVE